MANSSFEKFTQFLQEEDVKKKQESEIQKQEKETVRQSKIKGIKESLPLLSNEYENLKMGREKTVSGLEEDLSQRQFIKDDGRQTLAKAQEAGKVDVLRKNSKDFFANNITKLKDINAKVIDNRKSLKSNQEYLSQLGQEISKKKEELSQLENEPLNEKIQELETQYNLADREYKNLNTELEKKSDTIKKYGLRKEENGSMAVRAHGWGASRESLDDRLNFYSKENELSDEERTPTNKSLDKIFGEMLPDIQENLRDNEDKYKKIESDLLTIDNYKNQNALNRLKFNYNLSDTDLAEIRELVINYEKLQEDYQVDSKRRDDLREKILAMSRTKETEEKNLFKYENNFELAEKNLVDAHKELTSNLDYIKYRENEIKEVIKQKEELIGLSRQMEADFQRKSEELAKYSLEIDDQSLEKPGSELAKINIFLEKIREEVKQKKTELIKLESKKIVLNKQGKIANLNREINVLESQDDEISNFYNYFTRLAYTYQDNVKEINKKEQKTMSLFSDNNNTLIIDQLNQKISQLEEQKKLAEEELITAKAWTEAKF